MSGIERELLDQIRELRKELAGFRQRDSQRLLTGTVEFVSGARVRVQLTDDGEDGPVLTPHLRMAATTGKRGGGVSEFTKLGVGDPVIVVSPNGEVGTMSAVMPWIDTEDDPSPGAAETDGKVMEIGDAKIEVKNGMIRLSVGGKTLTLTADALDVIADVKTTGTLKNNNKDVGSTHKHKDVLPGGSLTGIPN